MSFQESNEALQKEGGHMVKKFMNWICQIPAWLLLPHEDGLEQWERLEFNKPTSIRKDSQQEDVCS